MSSFESVSSSVAPLPRSAMVYQRSRGDPRCLQGPGRCHRLSQCNRVWPRCLRSVIVYQRSRRDPRCLGLCHRFSLCHQVLPRCLRSVTVYQRSRGDHRCQRRSGHYHLLSVEWPRCLRNVIIYQRSRGNPCWLQESGLCIVLVSVIECGPAACGVPFTCCVASFTCCPALTVVFRLGARGGTRGDRCATSL